MVRQECINVAEQRIRYQTSCDKKSELEGGPQRILGRNIESHCLIGALYSVGTRDALAAGETNCNLVVEFLANSKTTGSPGWGCFCL